MKPITTTSGDIVNLDQVAMITVGGRESAEPELIIHFSACLSTDRGAASLRLSLRRDEARDFLKSLEAHGVQVAAALQVFEKASP